MLVSEMSNNNTTASITKKSFCLSRIQRVSYIICDDTKKSKFIYQSSSDDKSRRSFSGLAFSRCHMIALTHIIRSMQMSNGFIKIKCIKSRCIVLSVSTRNKKILLFTKNQRISSSTKLSTLFFFSASNLKIHSYSIIQLLFSSLLTFIDQCKPLLIKADAKSKLFNEFYFKTIM